MKLIFVYNADSGVLSSLKDTVHKAVSPSTYQCNLCRVTFGAVSMKDEWKEYIASLPHDVEFLHRDEFQKRYSDKRHEPLPALFVEKGSGVEAAIPASAVNAVHSIKDLISLVSTFLKTTHQ